MRCFVRVSWVTEAPQSWLAHLPAALHGARSFFVRSNSCTQKHANIHEYLLLDYSRLQRFHALGLRPAGAPPLPLALALLCSASARLQSFKIRRAFARTCGSANTRKAG